MIRHLIKNNMKLMFRNPANLFLFIAGPLLVLSVLASAFSSLLESYKKQEPFVAGYRLAEASFYAAGVETLKAVAKEADMTFEEYPKGEPKELMDSHDLKVFVDFGEETCVVWKREDAKMEGQTVEYLLNSYVLEVDRGKLKFMSAMAGQGNPGENPLPGAEESMPEEGAGNAPQEEFSLDMRHPNFMPAINSTDYYGIVEVVYFGWCALVCAAGILGNEKKYGIRKKYQVAGMSQLQVYLGRLIPMFLVVLICESIAAVISLAFLDVHWGDFLQSAAVMILMVLAASAFELMLYALTDSMVLSIILSFAIVWVWGFFGGTFETYIFSGASKQLKLLSPIYYGNRALTELSCMGHSDFVVGSILVSAGMAVVCSILAVLFGMARKRG